MRPGNFMATIDTSNALISLHLHKDSMKICSFEFKSNKYNFNVLPFRIDSFPRIFTEIMKLILSYLRSKNNKVLTQPWMPVPIDKRK